MKWLKKTLIWLLGSLVVLIGAVWAIAKYKQDKLVEIAINSLNKSWPYHLEMQSAQVDIFSQFPNLSVSLDSVRLYPSKSAEASTRVLSCDHLFLESNLLKALNGEFEVKEMDAEGGEFRWTEQIKEAFEQANSGTESDSSDVPISLEAIALTNMDIKIWLPSSDFSAYTHVDQLRLTGELSKEEFEAEFSSDMWVDHVMIQGVKYMNKEAAYLSSNLDISFNTSTVSFKAGTLVKGGSQIQWNGQTACPENHCDVNLDFEGSDISLEEISRRMGDLLGGSWKACSGTGDVMVKGNVQGRTDQTMKVTTEFNVTNANVKKAGTQLELTNLQMKGIYDGTRKEPWLVLDEVKGQLKNSTFNTRLEIKNFDRPKIKLELEALGNAEDILPLLNDSSEIDVTGPLDIVLNYQGTMSSGNQFTIDDYQKSITEGQVKLNGVKVNFGDKYLPVTNAEGVIAFRNNDLILDHTSFNLGASHLSFAGKLKGGIAYFMVPQAKMEFVGTINSKNLMVDELLVAGPETESSNEIIWPERISFSGSVVADELSCRRFYGTQVNARFKLNKGGIWVKHLKANTMNGDIAISGSLIQSKVKDRLAVKADWNMNKVAIDQLIYDFEGLGQDFILPDQIKGRATSSGELQCLVTNKLDWDLNTLAAKAKIEVENGELIGHPSVIELAEYVAENKLIRRVIDTDMMIKNAGHIKFESLENEITVVDGKVIIPRMHIGSSAMDIDIEGVHHFNDSIDYHMNFLLSDVMRKSKENVEGITVKPGHEKPMRIFLHMTGTTENPDISLDKSEVKQAIKKELKQEAKTVKAILKEEVGLYKNDTSVVVPEDEPEKPAYEIEWEEDPELEAKSPKEVVQPEPEPETKPLKIFQADPEQEPVEEADPEQWDDDF